MGTRNLEGVSVRPELSDRYRKIAILSSQGMKSPQIAKEVDRSQIYVERLLRHENIKKFREEYTKLVTDKIASKSAESLNELVEYLNEHVKEHIKSIHSIGTSSLTEECPVCHGSKVYEKKECKTCHGTGFIKPAIKEATRLRANELFCRAAGVTFKEHEVKVPEYPDLKISVKKEEEKKVG